MPDFIINVSNSFRENKQNIVSNFSLFLQNTIPPEQIRFCVFLTTGFFFSLVFLSVSAFWMLAGSRDKYKNIRSEKMLLKIFSIFLIFN